MIAALNSQNVATLNSVSAATSARTTPGITNSGPAAVSAISPQAELLAKLSELKESDPEQFQATLSKMADELRSAAKDQGGAAAQHLNGLADKVAEAAKTGDLSLLQPDPNQAGGKPMAGRTAGGPPPGGPPPGGAPPGGGRSAGGAGADASKKSSQSQSAKDPADTNGDGTVSAAEKAIYALTHSASEASDSAAASSSASSANAT